METQLLLPNGDESPINWVLVLETLERLTSQCQDEGSRSKINTENFRNLGQFLPQITKEENSRYDVLVMAFRFLRNSVAACERNQDAIRQDSTVFEVTANFLQLEGQPETTSNFVGDSSDRVVAIRCALQFLANFIVENETNAVLMSSVFSTHIVPLHKNFHQDEKVVQYIAMILHLLLKQCPANITVDQELLSSLLQNLHLEFVIYAMESLVAQVGVLGSLYEDAEPKLRIQLLTFLNERADVLNNLNEKVVTMLRDNFVERSDFILKSKVGDSDDVFSWEIAILLETLCGISATGNELLKSDSVLMTTVLFLLRQIQEVGKSTDGMNENAFAPVEDLQKLTSKSTTQSSVDDIRAHPTFQFKAHLIRLIANISHRSKSNQDLVRELECLPIILDNCKIDARNPFIGQWSVLAIRNLCEGNDTNQLYIREVQRIDTEKLLPKLELVDLS
ncbi:Ataxin-10 [Orchesella cincta]|uniref:Ataxin-10 n=1 Tax=Orchesella cincta TaxID=48709 RepID=A0A1D2MQG6_ORCCI|nr:Ataxin-10 [Orchesella cincta]